MKRYRRVLGRRSNDHVAILSHSATFFEGANCPIVLLDFSPLVLSPGHD
jgi:hypothetical protein